MPYGICHLSLCPVRSLADHSSEMCTQLLYGDLFAVLENRKEWSRIRLTHDGSEGWVCNRQYIPLSDESFRSVDEIDTAVYSSDLVAFSCADQQQLVPVLMGSSVGQASLLGHRFEGATTNGTSNKPNITATALMYLHAPYLRGGRSPFGIDSPGLAQMVYRMHGIRLPRSAADQAAQGQALSFIEESEAGDLAFFDTREGDIDHVGIIMKDNYIIHAFGKVRIDRLDHTGIFNAEAGLYSHSLRVIKKIA